MSLTSLLAPAPQLHLAEWVSPGHPDRLADAVAESLVDLAVAHDPESLVGVEVAVHRDALFVTGRIASGTAFSIPCCWMPTLTIREK